MKVEMLNTGPHILVGRSELFIYRRCWQHDWWRRESWGFDADGVFAICTPWFMWYPWLVG
jgi:hypothetical protein